MSSSTLERRDAPSGPPAPRSRPESSRTRGWTLAIVATVLVAMASNIWSAFPAQTPSAQALSAASAEITNVTLGDTSIDGPGLWTSSSGTVRSVLAWTGTDPAHHLNVMTSAIGTLYGNKVILPDTSVGRPAVTRTPSGKVAIAWTGTDAANTLNVMYDVYGARTKLIFWGDNSTHSPALVAINDATLALAWTGTNSGQSLNLYTVNVGATVTKGTKTTLWSYSSASAPNLSYESSRSEYLLSWSAASNSRVAFSTSSDAKSWSSPTTIAEWSYAAPSLLGIVGDYYGMPQHYVAWAGTDTNRSFNFQYTTAFPSWPNPTTTKVTLADSVWGAPALGFISGPGLVLAAWTSTDTLHHLNVAVLTPMVPPPCSLPGITSLAPKIIRQGTSGRKEVALTFDEDEGIGNPASLLDTLKSKGVPSTWFMTARWAQEHPSLVTRAQNEGIVIGNHTVDHPNLISPARSDTYVCYQLGLANQIIADRAGINGTRPYFRPPYGNYNTQVVNLAAQLGYNTVLWSIDPRDWDDATSADAIYNTVKANLGPGKIILMHGGSLHEPEALPRVIDYIKSQGYSIVSLDRVLAP